MSIVSVKIDIKGMLKEINKIDNVPVAAKRAVRRYIDEDAEPAFLQTIETWNDKPIFVKSVAEDARGVIGQVWTDDKVYHILDGGADPHPIAPKKAQFLTFQTTFKPKTKPKWIGSQSGGKSGAWTRRRSVEHPGITAREFALTIAKETQPKIVAKFREELRKL